LHLPAKTAVCGWHLSVFRRLWNLVLFSPWRRSKIM
jgi:hypothetical protein